MKLFIDDERVAPDGWFLAKTNGFAMDVIFTQGKKITHVSFDHDNGDAQNGFIPAVKYACENLPKSVEMTVHSSNPIGRKNIIALCKDYGFKCRQVKYYVDN